MPRRDLPVRPDLRQLRIQAKELLRAIRRGDPAAVAELREQHPDHVDPATARLADAQLVLARSYGAPSWPRLATACHLVDAIWEDDVDTVRTIVTRDPRFIHECPLFRGSNWGAPMSYAANLGRDRIIAMLHDLGATDFEHALDRAALQGRIETARMLHDMMGRPRPSADSLGGPAYTVKASGVALLLEPGAPLFDEGGRCVAPVDIVLESDSRRPADKHAILEMFASRGVALPDTPPMAVHRGRIDLLEAHLRRDPGLLSRRFTHEEIYPPELGCHDEVIATHGTPLGGTSLLHMCIDYDELEIARWLLARGIDPNLRATVDADGFGGHTALFATVVSQPAYGMNRGWRTQAAPFTELLLAHGADPNVRCSLRKQLHPGYGEGHTLREYRDVTPLSWGERFEDPLFVSRPAMRLIEAAGGVP